MAMLRSPFICMLVIASAAAGAATAPATRPAGTGSDPRVLRSLLRLVNDKFGYSWERASDPRLDQVMADAETAVSALGTAPALPARLGMPARLPFDDAANRAFLVWSDRVIHDYKVTRPDFTAWLCQRNSVAPLTGADLELLADLEEGQLRLVFAALPGQAKR